MRVLSTQELRLVAGGVKVTAISGSRSAALPVTNPIKVPVNIGPNPIKVPVGTVPNPIKVPV